LRDDESFLKNLAYVIEEDGKIVGHINYSRGTISYESGIVPAVVLGPLAIKKGCQNHGLGSKLIDYTLQIAQGDNIPFVLVIGDENYYSRFGFVSASEYGLYLDGTDLDEENPLFMIRVFDEGKVKKELGIFRNPDVFDVDDDEVDEFDSQFEYREKLVLDTQLKEL
jgi:predicted N-acetyltransferase YhbS